MELKLCVSDKHHRYYKHTKFRQNPRGDPKFLVDLTRNDPYGIKAQGCGRETNIAQTSAILDLRPCLSAFIFII